MKAIQLAGGFAILLAQEGNDSLQKFVAVQGIREISHLRLDVAINPGTGCLKGTVHYWFRVDSSRTDSEITAVFWLDTLLLFRRGYVSVRPEPDRSDLKSRVFAEFIPHDGMLELRAHLLRLPVDTVVVSLEYAGCPRRSRTPPWDGGFVKVETEEGPWLAVACQSSGARIWFPSLESLVWKPRRTSIVLEVPDTLQAISNGVLWSEGASLSYEDFRRYEWLVNAPIHYYNITFYVGPYQCEDYTLAGRDVRMCFRKATWQKYGGTRIWERFLNETRKTLTFLEGVLGPYPFPMDGVKIVEAPYWGMEHQSAIAYGNRFRLNGARKYCPFDFLLFHEMAHEWWGNSVSAARWQDLWLHEGFATFMEVLYVRARCGREAMSRYFTSYIRKNIRNRMPVLTQARESSPFADNDIYFRAAAALLTFQELGPGDSVWTWLREFQETYRYRAVTSDTLWRWLIAHPDVDTFAVWMLQGYLQTTTVPELVLQKDKKQKSWNVVDVRWEGLPPSLRDSRLLEWMRDRVNAYLAEHPEIRPVSLADWLYVEVQIQK